jgi:dienelactone hydrolase
VPAPKKLWTDDDNYCIDATGNTSSKRGVVVVYDIFGFYPQTLQGADLLAQHLDAVALVPDFFEGTQADKNWLPPNTEEKKAAFGKFRATTADPAKNLDKLKAVIREAKTKYASVEKWAVLGLCWGGKVR